MRMAHPFVHVDLKGAPPRPGYLIELFPLLADWGCTGLLIEWEDMLPWEGPLAVARSPQAYSAAEVKMILAAAARAGLQVVPLVQCFGHVEWLLKHDQFALLREVEGGACVCPLLPGSAELVHTLFQQVVAHHPACTAIHIGCDEVHELGRHPLTASALARGEPVFARHLATIVSIASELGRDALFWHDLVVKQLPAVRAALGALAPRAIPVVWDYEAAGVGADAATELRSCFPRVWAAAAFKGANEAHAVFPPLRSRVDNVLAWRRADAASRAGGRAGGVGAADTPLYENLLLTGWSRFAHHATLCELLCAAVPSLRICLAAATASPESLPRAAGDVAEAQRASGCAACLRELSLPDVGLLDGTAAEPLRLARESAGTFPGAAAWALIAGLQEERRCLQALEADDAMFGPSSTARPQLARDREAVEAARACVERLVALRPRLEAALAPVLFKPDVDELLRTKLDALRERADQLIAASQYR